MKVVGFTFVRNAIKYDYPVLESINSLLPLCDEVVVAVGNSDDGTLALIQGIGSPKIRIIETVWDDTLREGGRVLAVETDKALAAVPADADWAIYLQADEVLHEADYPAIRAGMERWKDDKAVEGLLLNYRHFYGSYDYVGDSYRWYRREIRIVRPGIGVQSYRDAQGFRRADNRKLRVKLLDATVHHYGWVKPPAAMQRKQETFNKLWHSDEWVAQHVAPAEEFDYSQVDSLQRFTGTHPATMQPRIDAQNWRFDHDMSRNRYRFKDRFKQTLERLTGYRLGEYKNYELL
ncbi:glycosyltransferase family 2 protein [Hymenobacter sp. DH14]|uniref:Glycosyltransferase family 2 protein n=1 Tax=Hymenobacter cyanobacteriorum TaxID=2926463 RepID=A0A9X2AES6_9BACT|nr:glycosyltransferase family 2 protein [Hymenobacter cyanobacteriorum]MCI1187551.1 glycosyltransferase family 2 protein [Hymenobacter cyanobacteriorum]